MTVRSGDEPKPVQQATEDLRVGLCDTLVRRHDRPGKPTHEREALAAAMDRSPVPCSSARSSEPLFGAIPRGFPRSRSIGPAIISSLRSLQALISSAYSGCAAASAAHDSAIGTPRSCAACHSSVHTSPEKPLHLGFVVDQPAIQVTGIPVQQHAAEVEDDGIRFGRLRGAERSQLWILTENPGVGRVLNCRLRCRAIRATRGERGAVAARRAPARAGGRRPDARVGGVRVVLADVAGVLADVARRRATQRTRPTSA